MDGTAGQGTGWNPVDENRHLAKVRVAGSNPVFRSVLADTKEGREARSGRKPDKREGDPKGSPTDRRNTLRRGNYSEVR